MKMLLYLVLFMIIKCIATLPSTVGVKSNFTETTGTTQTTDSNNSEEEKAYTALGTIPIGFTMHMGKTMFPSKYFLSTTGQPPQTTMLDRYIFESVDYEEIPQKLKDEYYDCYGQHIRCVRHRTDHSPVCGYNLWNSFYSDYYGPCEIDLQNCYHRMKRGFGVYGTDYKNDVIYYNGEGYNCVYYMRMAKTKEDMDELYFGEEIYRLQEKRN